MSWKLIHCKSGVEVLPGDMVIDFRGDRAVVADFTGQPPHKSGSTGRIYTGDGHNAHYPSVYDCKWVES